VHGAGAIVGRFADDRGRKILALAYRKLAIDLGLARSRLRDQLRLGDYQH
jgi:hypothetical protein